VSQKYPIGSHTKIGDQHDSPQVLPMVEARENILALVGVIGLIGILFFIATYLRSISPYPGNFKQI
jgi:hypothetical protein